MNKVSLIFIIIALCSYMLSAQAQTASFTQATSDSFGTQGSSDMGTDIGTGTGGTDMGMVEANITETVSKFEIEYLKYMLDHHYVGIRASALCLQSDKQVKAPLRQLCRFLNATERAQFDILQDLLSFYFDEQYTGFLDLGSGSGIDSDIDTQLNVSSSAAFFWQQQLLSLENATDDTDFETKLLRFLIIYEGTGIVSSVPCAQTAFHKELIDFCIGEMLNLGAQMGQVRALLCGWHDICQIELTNAEVKAHLDTLDFVTLGLGKMQDNNGDGGEATGLNTSTDLETRTVTDIGTQVGDTFVL